MFACIGYWVNDNPKMHISFLGDKFLAILSNRYTIDAIDTAVRKMLYSYPEFDELVWTAVSN